LNKEYIVLFEPDEGGWTASVPDLPGCLSDGNSFEEAESNIHQAIQLWIETARENGWPIPEPRVRIERFAV